MGDKYSCKKELIVVKQTRCVKIQPTQIEETNGTIIIQKHFQLLSRYLWNLFYASEEQ